MDCMETILKIRLAISNGMGIREAARKFNKMDLKKEKSFYCGSGVAQRLTSPLATSAYFRRNMCLDLYSCFLITS